MNHTCQLFGHDFGDWNWVGSAGNVYTPKFGSLGGYDEYEKVCVRCQDSEREKRFHDPYAQKLYRQNREDFLL